MKENIKPKSLSILLLYLVNFCSTCFDWIKYVTLSNMFCDWPNVMADKAKDEALMHTVFHIGLTIYCIWYMNMCSIQTNKCILYKC